MEKDESECVHKNINRQKDENNETGYEEYSVTDEVPICFNIFKYGGNLLNRLDVKYERACMATKEEEYYTDLLETMIEHNNNSKTPLSKKNFDKK